MIVKLLPEHHLEFLSLKGGCRGSSESTLVKMPHCWKSPVTAQYALEIQLESSNQVTNKFVARQHFLRCLKLYVMEEVRYALRAPSAIFNG